MFIENVIMSKEVQVLSGKIKMRQVFSEAEKIQAVADSYQSSLSMSKFARSIGVAPPTLCVWRKRIKEGQQPQERQEWVSPSPTHFEDVLKENQTLKQELQALKSENFQLKAFVGHKVFEFEGRSSLN
jgi:transposase-like protein